MHSLSYDLIGDIHGQHDKLVALLRHLDYEPHGSGFQHPAGRRVIFLGDYIDRGPMIRETLQLVRAMVDEQGALGIMGNHEFNAICYATADGHGGYLRAHSDKNQHQHGKSLAAFAGREQEWSEWIEWMKRLPMFLDLGSLRAVHACWDSDRLPLLTDQSLTDDDFLRACADAYTDEYQAIENVLKGPELALPEGVVFKDKEGVARSTIRARWWALVPGLQLGEIVMPQPIDLPNFLTSEEISRLPNYAAAAPPVFCGHYWLPPHAPKQPLARNIACLDYSAAFAEHPLVAYRWDGESELHAEKFSHVGE